MSILLKHLKSVISGIGWPALPTPNSQARISPTIKPRGTIEVQVRTLPWIVKEYGLTNPDILFADIHGAEYAVLNSLTKPMLKKLKVIFCECCSVEFHKGGRTLEDIKPLLAETHDFISWDCPDGAWTKMGDALWLRKGWGSR